MDEDRGVAKGRSSLARSRWPHAQIEVTVAKRDLRKEQQLVLHQGLHIPGCSGCKRSEKREERRDPQRGRRRSPTKVARGAPTLLLAMPPPAGAAPSRHSGIESLHPSISLLILAVLVSSLFSLRTLHQAIDSDSNPLDPLPYYSWPGGMCESMK